MTPSSLLWIGLVVEPMVRGLGPHVFPPGVTLEQIRAETIPQDLAKVRPPRADPAFLRSLTDLKLFFETIGEI